MASPSTPSFFRLTADERPLTEPFCRASVWDIAVPFLEQRPEELDRLLDGLRSIRSRDGYLNLTSAAILLELPLKGRHLSEYSLFYHSQPLLHHIATHAHGNVIDALLKTSWMMILPDFSVDCLSEAAFLAELSPDPDWEPFVPLAKHWTSQVPDPTWMPVLRTVSGLVEHPEFARHVPMEERTPWLLEDLRQARDQILDQPFDCFLPEEPAFIQRGTSLVRKAEVGRNDRCPCGSGKKYKHCCLGKAPREERMEKMSPIHGLTERDFWADPEPHVDLHRVLRFRMEDLLQLDPGRLTDSVRIYIADALYFRRDVYATLDYLERWENIPPLAGFTLSECFLVWSRLHAWHLEDWVPRLRRICERMDGGSPVKREEWDLIDPEVDATRYLESLEIMARQALDSEQTGGDDAREESIFAMQSLSTRYPAISLYLHRGLAWQMSPRLLQANDCLRESIHRSLGFDAGDPFHAFWRDWHDHAHPTGQEHDPEQSAALQAELEKRNAELVELQQRLEETEASRAALEAQGDKTDAPTEDPRVAELRERLQVMRADLTTRHEERNRLRRELMEARTALSHAHEVTRRVAANEPAEEEGWEEEVISTEVRIPVFSERFRSQMASLPKPAVARAISAMGQMAAHEPNAFANVKRLTLDRRFYRKRLGGYRLLFTLSETEIVAESYVIRADLDRAIGQLRRVGQRG